MDLKIIEDLIDQIIQYKFNDYTLMSGSLGRVLLLSSCKNRYTEIVRTDLLKAVAFLDKYNYSDDTTLCNGMTGLGWVIQTAQQNDYDIQLSRSYWSEMNKCIVGSIELDLKNNNYDYLHGVIGKLYYLKLIGGDKFHNSNRSFLKFLSDSKVTEGQGIAWRKPLFLNTKYQHSKRIKYDIGLAHGIPSILNYLSDIYLIEKTEPITYDLISDCIKFLVNIKQKHSKTSIYPSFIYEDNEPNESRLAWCYGDLGVAYAICKAALVCERIDWQEEAIQIALDTCKRKSHLNTSVFDSSFCHGAAGLGLLYLKMFEITSDENFKTASNYWNSIVEGMIISTKKKSELKYLNQNNQFDNKYGLLDGQIGTVLSVLYSRQQCNKNWTTSLSI